MDQARTEGSWGWRLNGAPGREVACEPQMRLVRAITAISALPALTSRVFINGDASGIAEVM